MNIHAGYLHTGQLFLEINLSYLGGKGISCGFQ